MQQKENEKPGCFFIGGIVLVTVLITVGVTFWVLTQYIFPKQFKPVELSQSEQQKLDQKLEIFSGWSSAEAQSDNTQDESAEGTLKPEKYSEEGANRTIKLSERELNGLLTNNTDMAQKLAIDLSDNLASGNFLIPLDPNFPVMGGKNLRITAGLELAYRTGRPIVVLKGVSVMGVPIPNAWLGGMKNVDLVSEFGADDGFWSAFAAGVEDVSVTEGHLQITLKE